MGAYPLVIGAFGWAGDESREPALSSDVSGLFRVLAVELGVFALVFGLAWWASRASKDDLLWRWRGGLWPVPLGIGYSIAIRFALGLILVVVGVTLVITQVASTQGLQDFLSANRPEVEAVVDVTALRDNPVYFWLSVTLVSFVLAGLREELWRSGFLAGLKNLWPGRFGSKGGQIVGAAVAAVVFGLGHLAQGPVAVCLTGLLGFGLGVIMVLHRSIWPAVIAHGMFDATSLALLPWAMEKLQELQRGLVPGG
jgi:membrane protease YdiL (CAAX protease family)